MGLYRKAKHLMRHHRILAKRRLGQNFMVDDHYLSLMVSYAEASQSDIVLEVGAGFGFLTTLLARNSGKVIAVETDARLVKILYRELARFDNVELIEGDILKSPIPPFDKIVSNPPFSISSPLLFWLLKKNFDCAVLTFQREFGERLIAPIGSKDYSHATVLTHYRAEASLLDPVPPEAFLPPPEVEAVIVKLKPRRAPPFKVLDEELFEQVLQTLFTQRNRKVRNAVLPLIRKRGLPKATAAGKADALPFHGKRVRELAPEEFGVLTNELS